MKRPEDSLAEMIANLEAKTGRTLEGWAELVRAKGLAKHGEIVGHLKTEHGVSHGYANQIALNLLKKDQPADEDLFSGKKAGLRPIYDALMARITAFGADIDVAPKKGYLSIRRSKQFAIMQPSTGDRLDVGINLKGVSPSDRFEASGSFNAMLSHRVRVTTLDQVDDELVDWLRQAYDKA